jgi:hypothetical protein
VLDPSQPGWTTRQGQAVWKRDRRAPEIAGELTVVQHRDGRAWLQFAKPPLPFLTARIQPEGWELHLVAQDRRWAAAGRPPDRLVWLQLLLSLQGQSASARWTWRSPTAGDWTLEDLTTGESITGYLDP